MSTDWDRVETDLKEARQLTLAVNTWCETNPPFRGIESLRPEDFKTKDTAFILGSGTSVNAIPGGVASLKTQGDLIGLNFSLLLPAVPDVFFVHEPWLPKPTELERYFALLDHCYGTAPVPLIYDFRQTLMAQVPIDMFPPRLRERVYLNCPTHLPCTDAGVLREAMSAFDDKGWFDSGFGWLIHHMSTMTLAVNFAICAGYRNVVLLGVDLRDAKYFFDEMTPDVPAELLPQIARDRSAMHSTADPKFELRNRSLPVDVYLLALKETVMDPKGIGLFIGSATSLLHPRLPVWPGLA